MSEGQDNQKKQSGDFRKLLQERIDKSNPRLTLIAEEQRRPSKLESIATRLNRRENVQKTVSFKLG